MRARREPAPPSPTNQRGESHEDKIEGKAEELKSKLTGNKPEELKADAKRASATPNRRVGS